MKKRDIKKYSGWMICEGDPEPKTIYHCENCGKLIRQTKKPFYFDWDFDRYFCTKRCSLSS